MKKITEKSIFSIVMAIIVSLTMLFSLSSCGGRSVMGALINEKGELVLYYDNGDTQNLGIISKEETTVVIESEGGSASAATTAGLMSAVTITANFEKTVNNSYGGFPGFGGFGGTTTQEYSAEGSGVIYKIDREGGSAFIITNYHVVYDGGSNTSDGISDDIEIYLYGREYEQFAIPAEYVGGSLYYDIAVLYVEDCDALREGVYNSASIADSESVSVGETAIAIGNPEGYGISASLGIVSVNSEYITMTAADGLSTVSFRVIRVDTAVNSGNSGGGLYNDKGELIGIVNAKIIDSSVENIGYAIPSNVACAVADNIIDNCYGSENKTVMRALLGITLGVSDSRAVVDTDEGIIKVMETVGITEISEDSIAYGKLKVGDEIKSVTVDGEITDVTRRYHIIDEMLDARIGDTVTVNVIRGGEEISVTITITEDCIVAY